MGYFHQKKVKPDRLLARNIRGGIFLAILIGGLGFIHVVQTDSFITIVPKSRFTFSNTFTSVSEIVARYNNRSLGDAIRGDSQLDHLVRELECRGEISNHKRTWSEVEDQVRSSLPDQ